MNIKQLVTQLKAILLLIWKINQLGPIQRKWIWSLIIHPKRQGKNVLGWRIDEKRYKACCLGELGLIAGVCTWDLRNPDYINLKDGAFSQTLEHSYHQLGLYCASGSHGTKDGSLAGLNDNENTWPEIALEILKDPIQYLKEKK